MKHPEEAIQKTIVEYIRWIKPPCLAYHIPNQGDIPVSYRKRLLDMGLYPGVYDLGFILPGGQAGFMEIKDKYRQLSDSQEAFKASAQILGAKLGVARSLEDAQSVLREWGL